MRWSTWSDHGRPPPRSLRGAMQSAPFRSLVPINTILPSGGPQEDLHARIASFPHMRRSPAAVPHVARVDGSQRNLAAPVAQFPSASACSPSHDGLGDAATAPMRVPRCRTRPVVLHSNPQVPPSVTPMRAPLRFPRGRQGAPGNLRV